MVTYLMLIQAQYSVKTKPQSLSLYWCLAGSYHGGWISLWENTESDRHGNQDQVYLAEAVPQRQHTFLLLHLITVHLHYVLWSLVCLHI